MTTEPEKEGDAILYSRTIREGPNYRLITNSYSRVLPKGIPRQEKRKKTPEEMERANRRERARRLQCIILGNFKEGYHATLTYPKERRPRDALEAKKDLQKFLRKMKRKFQKEGFEFKWIAVTEIGSKGGIHHHLILEELHEGDFSTTKALRECWQGGMYLSILREDGSFRELADYLTKKETKEDVPGCKVSHSRNLIMPKVKRQKKKGRQWLPEPREPRGWHLVKDSLENGFNPITGYPVQTYLLIRDG